MCVCVFDSNITVDIVGIGKSSLIHAFGVVPDIDGPLSTTPYTDTVDRDALDDSAMDVSMHGGDRNVSGEIKKWYASTMTPSQKQYQGREPLARNICFVDTPGYGAFVDVRLKEKDLVMRHDTHSYTIGESGHRSNYEIP